MVWSLVLCSEDAKKNWVGYDAEFALMFQQRVHVLHPYSRASTVSAISIRVLRQSSTFGKS